LSIRARASGESWVVLEGEVAVVLSAAWDDDTCAGGSLRAGVAVMGLGDRAPILMFVPCGGYIIAPTLFT
jgi:hypothetical protein